MNEAYKIKFNSEQPLLLFCPKQDRIEFEVVGKGGINADDFLNLCITNEQIRDGLIKNKPSKEETEKLMARLTEAYLLIGEINAHHDWAKSFRPLSKVMIAFKIKGDIIRSLEDYSWKYLYLILDNLLNIRNSKSLGDYLNEQNIEPVYIVELIK